jgi:hypothetical protein
MSSAAVMLVLLSLRHLFTVYFRGVRSHGRCVLWTLKIIRCKEIDVKTVAEYI